MRAVVLNGTGDVSVETVDDPALPGPRGIVLQVQSTAICGSDLHPYHGDMAAPGVRLGHEFIGRVVEAGSEVRTVGVDDRVLVSGVIGCGVCRECIAGWPMRCLEAGSKVFGTSMDLHGGQAEAVAVPAADTSVRRIPDGISDDQAVLLTDILPTGFIGARRADLLPGQTVAVIGLGPVGLRVALGAAVLAVTGPTFRICVADIPSTWDQLLPLVTNGRLQPEDVFTHRMGLSEAAEGYRIFDARDDRVMKVLLDPTA